MAIYSVTTNIPTDKGLFVWFPIESPLSLAEINERLIRDGSLIVTKLETDRNRDGAVSIRARKEMILNHAGIATIAPFHLRIAEGV